MKIVEKREYMLPAYSMSMIHNGDESGLDEEDIRNVQSFYTQLQNVQDGLKAEYFIIGVPDDEQEAYFSSYNDIDGSLGNDVYDIQVVFLREQ